MLTNSIWQIRCTRLFQLLKDFVTISKHSFITLKNDRVKQHIYMNIEYVWKVVRDNIAMEISNNNQSDISTVDWKIPTWVNEMISGNRGNSYLPRIPYSTTFVTVSRLFIFNKFVACKKCVYLQILGVLTCITDAILICLLAWQLQHWCTYLHNRCNINVLACITDAILMYLLAWQMQNIRRHSDTREWLFKMITDLKENRSQIVHKVSGAKSTLEVGMESIHTITCLRARMSYTSARRKWNLRTTLSPLKEEVVT